MYQRQLESGIIIQTMQADHADQLGALQELVFPTLAPDQLIRPQHYRHHVKMFPDGQFVALDGDQVVGMTSSIRLKFDFDQPRHTFAELMAGGWMNTHDPDGDWLYGMDLGVHPDYRRRGIARAIYQARHTQAVQRLGLKGQLIGGMMRGYGAVKATISAEDYYNQLVQGVITDPTVTPQMRIGFKPLALLPGYVNDPICDQYGVLLVLDADQEIQ